MLFSTQTESQTDIHTNKHTQRETESDREERERYKHTGKCSVSLETIPEKVESQRYTDGLEPKTEVQRERVRER